MSFTMGACFWRGAINRDPEMAATLADDQEGLAALHAKYLEQANDARPIHPNPEMLIKFSQNGDKIVAPGSIVHFCIIKVD